MIVDDYDVEPDSAAVAVARWENDPGDVPTDHPTIDDIAEHVYSTGAYW